MSDRGRQTIGIILAASSVAASFLPLFMNHEETSIRFHSVQDDQWHLQLAEQPHSKGIPVNYADAVTLMELPGIGETYASLIISERKQNGPFYCPEDLEAVHGIGPKTVEKLKDMIDLTIRESEE